uniref:SH2 domain-containing protein n=1 Tax=Macrostomum lignano TaxID=282301 RepID=A0A1I8IKP6_9PLAT
ASDTFVVNEAALEAARWLLLPLLSTEADEDTCWQLLTTASVPGEFWQRSRDVVYKLCSIAHGSQVQLLSQDGSSGVWNIGGFPDGGDVADEIAAALRPGPPGSFVEVDSRHRLAFVELTLDSGGDACPDDPGVNLSTILRFACGTKPGLVSAVQPGPCRHRLLLLTPLLCGQPAFRPRPARLNRIACRRVSPKSGAKSGPPRSLAELEASRDHGRLSSLLLGSMGSSDGTSKLRLGVGDASSEPQDWRRGSQESLQWRQPIAAILAGSVSDDSSGRQPIGSESTDDSSPGQVMFRSMQAEPPDLLPSEAGQFSLMQQQQQQQP